MVDLLHRFPNVIAWVAGHSHVNDVTPYPDGHGHGFWSIRVAAEADWPQQIATAADLRQPRRDALGLRHDPRPRQPGRRARRGDCGLRHHHGPARLARSHDVLQRQPDRRRLRTESMRRGRTRRSQRRADRRRPAPRRRRSWRRRRQRCGWRLGQPRRLRRWCRAGSRVGPPLREAQASQAPPPPTSPRSRRRGPATKARQAPRQTPLPRPSSQAPPSSPPLAPAQPAQSCGRAIRRWSSASSRIAGSTPCSRATSRSERPDSAASLTMSAARSYPMWGLSAVAVASVASA